MAIDWDRLVVESEHNGVIASAGQVALLVGADADTVTWGNITGDISQQADLMQIVDGFVSIDSPQFTGTPRTPTPPEGNRSTRIASTAYVQGELDNLSPLARKAKVDYETDIEHKPSLGTMSEANDVQSSTKLCGRKRGFWQELGGLASKDAVDYETEVTNKPTFGGMAWQDDVSRAGSFCGRIKGAWQQLGDMASASEPPRNTSANVFKKYVRTNEGTPAWEQVDEPPENGSATPRLFARTSYMEGTPPDHVFKYGWSELHDISNYSEPPLNSSTVLKKKYVRTNENGVGPAWEEVDEAPVNTTTKEKWYARTSVTVNSKRVFDWAELGSMAFETAKLEEVFVDSSNGSDTNDGTSGSKAVRTIGKALELATSAGHCTIFAAAGTYNENELQIDGKNVTFECLTSGGTIEINNNVNRTDSFGLYLIASKVVFNCKVDITTVKGTGVYVDYGSSLVAAGLTVHTPNTCIKVENASSAYVSTLYVYYSSALVADCQKGSTLSISYVWGDYGTSVTKVFNASGGIIMYGDIPSSGAHALNYSTLSTTSQGGLVRG